MCSQNKNSAGFPGGQFNSALYMAGLISAGLIIKVKFPRWKFI